MGLQGKACTAPAPTEWIVGFMLINVLAGPGTDDKHAQNLRALHTPATTIHCACAGSKTGAPQAPPRCGTVDQQPPSAMHPYASPSSTCSGAKLWPGHSSFRTACLVAL